MSLESISSRVQEVKESLQAFLAKLEMEQMNWFVRIERPLVLQIVDCKHMFCCLLLCFVGC